MVSKERLYKQTLTTFKFHSLEEEFSKNEEVIIICPNPALCGQRARVTGYVLDKQQVKVKLSRRRDFKKEKLEILKVATTEDIFFSIRLVAAIVEIRQDILQTILGSIIIDLPQESKLPPSIDIGLNFVSRKDRQLVPNLVRINFGRLDQYEISETEKNPFKHL